MTDTSPGATLPYAFDLWYPIVFGPLHCKAVLAVDAESARERVREAWSALEPGSGLLLVDRDGRGLLRGWLARAFRPTRIPRIPRMTEGLDSVARVVRFHALPNTGGTWVLVPTGPPAATDAGLELLPAGRLRWRVARRVLRHARRTRHRVLDGCDQVALVVKEGSPESSSRPTPYHVTHGSSSAAIACGVPGRFQKIVARIADEDGEVRAFVKMSRTEDARERVRHEADALVRLAETGLASVGPRLLDRGEHNGVRFLVVEPLLGRRSSDSPGAEHVELLERVRRATQEDCALAALAPFVEARRELVRLVRDPVQAAAPLASALDRLAPALVRCAGANPIPCSLAHGDFTPWNLIACEDGLRAYDWEQMLARAPALYDLFHFHVQTGILVRRATPEQILAEIETCLDGPARGLAESAGVGAAWPLFLGLYLVISAVAEEADYRVLTPPFGQIAWLRAGREALALLVTEKIDAVSPKGEVRAA